MLQHSEKVRTFILPGAFSISARACFKYCTGIAISLRGLLNDEDSYVRCLTAQALTILAGNVLLVNIL